MVNYENKFIILLDIEPIKQPQRRQFTILQKCKPEPQNKQFFIFNLKIETSDCMRKTLKPLKPKFSLCLWKE